jgi:hypothetical protein
MVPSTFAPTVITRSLTYPDSMHAPSADIMVHQQSDLVNRGWAAQVHLDPLRQECLQAPD